MGYIKISCRRCQSTILRFTSISIVTINKIVSTFEKRCALVLKQKGDSINNLYNDIITIPHGENEVDELYGKCDNELDILVLPKFTEEEIQQYQESQRKFANVPEWNKQLDSLLIKYIITQNLSHKEAAKRLNTTNVEAVQKHMCELMNQSGIEI